MTVWNTEGAPFGSDSIGKSDNGTGISVKLIWKGSEVYNVVP
jgi:hypothetical protein